MGPTFIKKKKKTALNILKQPKLFLENQKIRSIYKEKSIETGTLSAEMILRMDMAFWISSGIPLIKPNLRTPEPNSCCLSPNVIVVNALRE